MTTLNDHVALEADFKIAIEALEKAEDALATCYQVTDYPANGESSQDYALASVRSALERFRR